MGRAGGDVQPGGRRRGGPVQDPLLLSGQLPASGSTWAPPRAAFPWPESLGMGRSRMGRACHHEGSPKSLRLPAWSQANNSSHRQSAGSRGEGAAVINSSTSCRRGRTGKAAAVASRAEQGRERAEESSGRATASPEEGPGGNPRLGPTPATAVLGPHSALQRQRLVAAGIQTPLPSAAAWADTGRREDHRSPARAAAGLSTPRAPRWAHRELAAPAGEGGQVLRLCVRETPLPGGRPPSGWAA